MLTCVPSVPSPLTDVRALTRLIALLTDPARLCIEAARADEPRSNSLGSATADKRPRMTITTINSISVKPLADLAVMGMKGDLRRQSRDKTVLFYSRETSLPHKCGDFWHGWQCRAPSIHGLGGQRRLNFMARRQGERALPAHSRLLINLHNRSEIERIPLLQICSVRCSTHLQFMMKRILFSMDRADFSPRVCACGSTLRGNSSAVEPVNQRASFVTAY